MQVWESRLQSTARWLTVALPVLLITGRAAADAALSLSAILFLIRCVATGDWSWTRQTWVRVALGLWVWMLIISNFAYKVGPSYTETLTWLRFIVFAAAAESWILDKRWIKRLVYVTGAAVLFTASDAILQYATGHDLFGHPRWDPTRLTGPFRHPEVGIYMARIFFPAVFGGFAIAFASKRKRLGVVLTTLATAIIVSAIFLSGERAALFLTLFGLLLIVFLAQGLKRTLAAAAVLIVAGLVLLQLKLPIVQRQFNSTVEVMSNLSDSPYGVLWRTGLMMGRNHPITGVGMHNFRYVCKEPTKHFPGCNIHPHNMYIQWFAASGIPGLLGFVILVSVWLRRLWRATIQSGSIQWWVLGPAMGVFVQIWPFVPTGGFFSNWNAVTFWLVLAWGLASARLYGNQGSLAAAHDTTTPGRDSTTQPVLR